MSRIEALTLKNSLELSPERINQIRERVQAWHEWDKATAQERELLPTPPLGEAKWLVKLRGQADGLDYQAASYILQKRTGGKIELANFGAEEEGHKGTFYYVGPFEDEDTARDFQEALHLFSTKIEGQKTKKPKKSQQLSKPKDLSGKSVRWKSRF